MDNLFSTEGRMRRKDFWISGLISPIIAIILILLVVALFKFISHALAVLIGVILAMMLIWHTLADNTKRCHDIGFSGWFQFIPFFELLLLFKAGDIGPNKYGPDPKQTRFKDDDDLSYRRPRSQFEEEMARIKAERELTT
jgi:uncharacterized membrane protein YhaH (DUF805 family)